MKKYFTFLAFIIAMQFATRLSAQNLSDSLLFHYPLDGNAIDVSGNGFNGNTWYGTYTDDRFGNPAGALSFNGYSTCITGCTKMFGNGLVKSGHPIRISGLTRNPLM